MYGSRNYFTTTNMGYNVLITGGWSDHDYKCTIDRHTPLEMNRTYMESPKV